MALERRTPLRAQPRGKGSRGERAVIDLLKQYGWRGAYRNYSSGAFGGGDILGGPAGVHIECKHHERCAIWAWLRQCESEARPTDIPMVVCRRNRMQWWAVMPVDEWYALSELTELHSYTLVRESRKCALWAWLEQAQSECPGSHIPVVRFRRPGGAEYAAVPATVVFGLLWERETAL